jgi:hypothetical protein
VRWTLLVADNGDVFAAVLVFGGRDGGERTDKWSSCESASVVDKRSGRRTTKELDAGSGWLSIKGDNGRGDGGREAVFDERRGSSIESILLVAG